MKKHLLLLVVVVVSGIFYSCEKIILRDLTQFLREN